MSNPLPLLREPAKSLRIVFLGTLRSCAGCSIEKGRRTPLPSSTIIITKSSAPDKLVRVFVDLSDPKRTPSFWVRSISCCIKLAKDDLSRFASVYLSKHEADAEDAFRKLLADARADRFSSKVDIVRSDKGDLKHKADLEDMLRKVLADARADRVPSKVDIVRFDKGNIMWRGVWRGVQTILHQAEIL